MLLICLLLEQVNKLNCRRRCSRREVEPTAHLKEILEELQIDRQIDGGGLTVNGLR